MKVQIGRFVFVSFDKQDWMAFSGASRLPDGREPLVCYLGENVLIIEGGCVNPTEYALTLLKTAEDGEEVENFTASFRSFEDLCEICNFLAPLK